MNAETKVIGNGKPVLVVLNGSFNPPTLGHLTLLKRAMAAVGAERGLFLPASDEYVRRKQAKANESVVFPAEKRVAMLEAMCAGDASLGVSRVDIGTDAPMTYDSLCKIAALEPSYDVVLAVGADKIKKIPRWNKSKNLLKEFGLVVSSRGNERVDELIDESKIANELKAAIRATFEIDGEVADVSSSEVRRLFAAGQDYVGLLHLDAARIVGEFKPDDFAPLSFEEWAKITLDSGRFGAGKVNKRIYEMNRDLFRAWAKGEPVDVLGGLGDRAALLDGTKVYVAAFDVNDIPIQSAATRVGCINDDCVEVAHRLVEGGYRPAILNLASRRHACGGYDAGLGAQEEHLCRTSTLSQSLYQHFKPSLKCVRESGGVPKGNAYPLDISFGGIYSPNVRFFRQGKEALFAYCDKPFDCGVVTVAALSFREPNDYCNDELCYRSPDGGFTAEGERIQCDKIRTIFRIALKHGHDSIVLGAFGCGVNKLPCEAVAKQFATVLNEPEFVQKFKAVVFAIREGRGTTRKPVEDRGKFAPFYSQFGRWQSTQQREEKASEKIEAGKTQLAEKTQLDGKTCLVGGNYCLDIIIKRSYPDGFVLGKRNRYIDTEVLRSGGQTAGNVSCILPHLGVRSFPIAHFDTTSEGHQIAEDLARHGADTRFVQHSPQGGTTLMACIRKRDQKTGESVIAYHGSSPGSRFQRHKAPRGRDEAPTFLAALDFTPSVFFFDSDESGWRVIAQGLREKGTLVYYEPESAKSLNKDAVAKSDIIKFS